MGNFSTSVRCDACGAPILVIRVNGRYKRCAPERLTIYTPEGHTVVGYLRHPCRKPAVAPEPLLPGVASSNNEPAN